ncbi:hypothetical protein Hanom_Chr03g00277301 [Helianthus anomalus]
MYYYNNILHIKFVKINSSFLRANLLNLRNMNREIINLISPRIFLLSWINRPQRFPHRTITLKTRPESNLPRSVTLSDPTLGLGVR